jgi:hypothetical protein
MITIAEEECKKHRAIGKTAIVSPCLNHRHLKKVSKRFFAGMESLKINPIECIKQNRYIIVYHGTKTLENVKDICHNGWNITLRNGQDYGKGEYFSEETLIASNYGEKGAIIGSIIIEPDRTSEQHDYGKSGYPGKKIRICTNTNDHLFAFPFCIIETNTHIDKIVCTKNIVQTQHFVYFFDNGWQKYDDNCSQFVLSNQAKGILTFKMKMQNMDYDIDLQNMIQTNLGSKKQRKIKIYV